ncbi:MAG: hypothetical protein ABH821_00385 [archaeon]
MVKSSQSEVERAEEKVYNTFSGIASSLGYSALHGKILAALLVEGSELSLPDLARKTSYSLSTLSLSLDFLEVLGVIKKFRKPSDRKVYVKLKGDLLEALLKAIALKFGKGINDSLQELNEEKVKLKGKPESVKVLKSINLLENEIKRLQTYVELISELKLPK